MSDITREEFEKLKVDVEAIKKVVHRDHAPRLAAVENAIDEFRSVISETRAEVRALGGQVGRMADLATTQAPVIEKMSRNLTRLVEIAEKDTVIVEVGK